MFLTSLALVLAVAPGLAQQPPQKPDAAATQQPAAQQPASKQPSAEQKPADAAAGTFSAEHLEQLVAPIALYPDSLLSQLLMASTYPLEIVEAARWAKANPGVTGDKLDAALKEQQWDPSVKSLCGFRDVLERMNENLDWTQDLGDAFLGQQAALMDAVQNMRRKAFDSGNLKSSKELTVTEQADKIIVIQAADPEVVYVPTYYPTAVYGSWSYPYWYYPPMYYPPPAGAAFFGFTVGVIWGSAMWGGCSWGWGHTEVDIDIDKQNNFIDRTEVDARRQEVKDRAGTSERARGEGNRATTSDRSAKGKSGWKHDPSHRKGVGYKDTKTAQQFGGGPGQTRVSRDQARGYGDGARASSRPSTTSRAATPSSRAASGASSRPTSRASSSSTGRSSGSFSGSRSPSLDRAGSQRGASSRGSAGARRGGGGGRGGRR